MLFGKRAVQLRFVKDHTSPDTPEATTENLKTVTAYAEIVKDVAGEVATLIIVVTVVKAACEIGRIFASAAVK